MAKKHEEMPNGLTKQYLIKNTMAFTGIFRIKYRGRLIKARFWNGIFYFNVGSISNAPCDAFIRISKDKIGQIRQRGLLEKLEYV